jgi:hypothetical protein
VLYLLLPAVGGQIAVASLHAFENQQCRGAQHLQELPLQNVSLSLLSITLIRLFSPLNSWPQGPLPFL